MAATVPVVVIPGVAICLARLRSIASDLLRSVSAVLRVQ